VPDGGAPSRVTAGSVPGRGAAVVVTCEHASAAVPPSLRAALGNAGRRRHGHRAFDRGAAALARSLAARLDAPLVLGTVSRLVVNLNRSPHNSAVFSECTRRLPRTRRDGLLRELHAPHWLAVERAVRAAREKAGIVVHLGAHSFVPMLHGRRRAFDVGLLYAPSRRRETRLCREWRVALLRREPWLHVRMNQPYRGVADGLTTALRRRLPARAYLGIEVEVNQALLRSPARWRRVRTALADTAALAVSSLVQA